MILRLSSRKVLCPLIVSQRCSSNISDLKTQIIDAATDFIPEYGWTRECIAAGAESLNLSGSVQGLFAHPASALALGFNDKCNRHLEEQLNEQSTNREQPAQNTTAKLTKGLKIKLEMLEPIIPQWPQGLAILSHARNIGGAAKLSLNMCDSIWHYAGDKSVDMTWYSKRLNLMAIYKSSELFMIQDMSSEFVDTYDFVARRLDQANAFYATSNQSQKMVANSFIWGKAGIATALNMMGIDSRPMYNSINKK